MRTRPSLVQLVALALFTCLPAGVCAQGSTPGTVTGHGTVELKRVPDVLRLHIEVLAKGKDLKEALARLKDRRETSQRFLEALGAVHTSIEFGEAAITDERTDREKQMELMMQNARVPGKKDGQKAKQSPPVVVAASLNAEVPLKAAGSEQLLLLTHSLEQKIKAADLGGMKELKQMSPQDEESTQEVANAMQFGGGDPNEPKRGEPIFLYVSKVSEDERAKALTQAFEKAKIEAHRLARAAGAALGPIHHIEDAAATYPGIEESTQFNEGRAMYYQMMQQGGVVSSTLRNAEQGGEAIGLQPGKVSYRVTLTAQFVLKKPGEK